MRLQSLFFAFAVLAITVPVGADDTREIFNPTEPFVSQPPETNPGLRATLTDAPDVVLYDNGPIVNCPGCGAGGADESQLQMSLGMNTLGAGHQFSLGYSVAEDFAVTDSAGWEIDTITFFAYQTGSSTTSTITGVYVQIWDGDPSAGGVVVWGDLATNRLQTTGWSNAYRVTDSSSGDTNRPIMANVATIGTTLAQGDYWVQWTTDGALASGPWAPPITINGETTTGNSLQYTSVWAPLLDSGTSTPQGLPFIIDGDVVGPPPPPPLGSFFVVDELANTLYSVDLDTAIATYIGPTVEDPSFSGMAFDTSAGIIYISDITMSGGWGLGIVDWVTGAVSIVGPHVNSTDIHALAYDAASQTLWGSDYACAGGAGLATVNRNTGESTCIGQYGTPGVVNGLAWRQTTDTLYGLNETDLLTIDRNTGAATAVGPHGIPGLAARYGLESIPDRSVLVVTTDSGDLYEVDPATAGSVLIGNTGLTDASGSAYVPFRPPAFLPFPGLLHDNGDTDFSNGYSNGIPPGLTVRRSLLDDFEVTVEEAPWGLRHFRWRNAWNSLTSPSGTGLELMIRTNDPNGGGPGIDGPGAVMAIPVVRFFAEAATNRSFFSRPEMWSIAEFDPVVLPAGRYWLEWAVIGPDNNFVPVNQSQIRDNECWIDYDDFGGLQPASSQFGNPGDLAWAIGDATLGIFADGFESGDTSAWSTTNP